jgi:hypothetical protein
MLGGLFNEPAGTINDVLVLFRNGIADPQVPQNDFDNSLSECS